VITFQQASALPFIVTTLSEAGYESAVSFFGSIYSQCHTFTYDGQIKKYRQYRNTTQKKQATQNTAKQIYIGSVNSYNTRPANKVGLFYNVHMGHVY